MSPRRDYDEDEPKPRRWFHRDRDVERNDEGSDEGSDEREAPVEREWLFDKHERKNFVAKVYAILSVNLAVSFAIIFGLCYSEEVREFTTDYWWIVFILMVIEVILYLVLACAESARKRFPLNFILLELHTLFTAGTAAWIAARYDLFVIWMAFLATAAITISVSIMAKLCPCDVTGCGIIFVVGFLALSVFSLIALLVSFFMPIKLIWLIISGITVVLLSFYLMFITQLILGGRKGEIEPDEVVLAVIILFSTIIDIFLHLLRLVGACGGDD